MDDLLRAIATVVLLPTSFIFAATALQLARWRVRYPNRQPVASELFV